MRRYASPPLRPLSILDAKKEEKFPRSEESCGKIFTGEKNLRYLNTRSRAPPNGGNGRLRRALLIATGCRIAEMQDFPVADMIPAMVLVMPLSALWTNYIAPLL